MGGGISDTVRTSIEHRSMDITPRASSRRSVTAGYAIAFRAVVVGCGDWSVSSRGRGGFNRAKGRSDARAYQRRPAPRRDASVKGSESEKLQGGGTSAISSRATTSCQLAVEAKGPRPSCVMPTKSGSLHVCTSLVGRGAHLCASSSTQVVDHPTAPRSRATIHHHYTRDCFGWWGGPGAFRTTTRVGQPPAGNNNKRSDRAGGGSAPGFLVVVCAHATRVDCFAHHQ